MNDKIEISRNLAEQLTSQDGYIRNAAVCVLRGIITRIPPMKDSISNPQTICGACIAGTSDSDHLDSDGKCTYIATAPISQFRIGDNVVKVTGDYRISGTVRAVFTMTNGAIRLVVEHKAEGGGSFLHIYGKANLEHLPC